MVTSNHRACNVVYFSGPAGQSMLADRLTMPCGFFRFGQSDRLRGGLLQDVVLVLEALLDVRQPFPRHQGAGGGMALAASVVVLLLDHPEAPGVKVLLV